MVTGLSVNTMEEVLVRIILFVADVLGVCACNKLTKSVPIASIFIPLFI
jgi:hypothetical protein